MNGLAVKAAALLALLVLAACASRPQMAMLNRRTGAVVDCALPDPEAGSGEFLVSRACLSACLAHGFRPVPGLLDRDGGLDTPAICLE